MNVAMDASLLEALRRAMREEMAGMFDELRGFVDRRVAELSAELHGAVQLMDYSEANLSGQLGRIYEQIGSLIAAPAAATRNSGLELEGVVQATETAASQIMEAAEAIADWVRDGRRDAESLEAVGERINSIFEACSFQDLTGQRIRRAIENLQHVETVLGGLISPNRDAGRPDQPTTPPPAFAVLAPHMPPVTGHDLAQAEIDRMLNDF
jgi:chemotaxis protein CheZ